MPRSMVVDVILTIQTTSVNQGCQNHEVAGNVDTLAGSKFVCRRSLQSFWSGTQFEGVSSDCIASTAYADCDDSI